MTLIEYRNQILDYLTAEKEYIEEDIKANEELSDEEKIDMGLMIQGCKVVYKNGRKYELKVTTNNTKLRPGDIVSLRAQGRKSSIKATIIENGIDRVTLETNTALSLDNVYDINIVQLVMTGTLIKLISQIDAGRPGATLLRFLGNMERPKKEGLGKLRFGETTMSDELNETQRQACLSTFAAPNLYCIQGPPGTGKTKVLATIANAFTKEGQMVKQTW